MALNYSKQDTDSAERADSHAEEDVFVMPVSFAQERVWYLDQLYGDIPGTNVPVAFHISGKLNADALEQSFNEIIRRHESLRTNFTLMDGKPVQVISPELRISLNVLAFDDLSEKERDTRVRHLIAEESKPPLK